MQKDDLTKTVAGALLVGVSVLSGNALLLTVAGGIGVNWSSEGLIGLWQDELAPHLTAGTPLEQAYARSLRKAVHELKKQYKEQIDSRSDLKAFEQLEACANMLSQATYAGTITGLAEVQHMLGRSIGTLLVGHDERQIRWLDTHLLAKMANIFPDELASDAHAWRQFHGWLMQRMAVQVASLPRTLQQVPAVLDRLNDAAATQSALEQASKRIEAQIATLRAELEQPKLPSASPAPATRTVSFNNQGATISTQQYVEGNIYNNGSLAADRGNSAIINRRSDEYPSLPPQIILAVFANAPDSERLSLLQEARTLQECLRPYSERFQLELLPACTIEDLGRALLRSKPYILHLSGHDQSESLLFEWPDGHSQLVSQAALVSQLKSHAPQLRCVILNACHSAIANTTIPVGIDVIAMRGPIIDDTAIAFTQGFYDALVAGRDVRFAFKHGCGSIQMKNLPDADLPVLLQW